MEKFLGYIIGVLISMALVIGLVWHLRGPETARLVVIFFMGWIVGAVSMYIKAWLVYRP